MLIDNWAWWANVILYIAIIIIAIAVIMAIIKFFSKMVFFFVKKIILPVILVAISLGVLFFIVVAIADTYFNTDWWEKTILPWFQGGTTGTTSSGNWLSGLPINFPLNLPYNAIV